MMYVEVIRTHETGGTEKQEEQKRKKTKLKVICKPSLKSTHRVMGVDTVAWFRCSEKKREEKRREETIQERKVHTNVWTKKNSRVKRSSQLTTYYHDRPNQASNTGPRSKGGSDGGAAADGRCNRKLQQRPTGLHTEVLLANVRLTIFCVVVTIAMAIYGDNLPALQRDATAGDAGLFAFLFQALHINLNGPRENFFFKAGPNPKSFILFFLLSRFNHFGLLLFFLLIYYCCFSFVCFAGGGDPACCHFRFRIQHAIFTHSPFEEMPQQGTTFANSVTSFDGAAFAQSLTRPPEGHVTHTRNDALSAEEVDEGRFVHPDSRAMYQKCGPTVGGVCRYFPIFGPAVESYGPRFIFTLDLSQFLSKGIAYSMIAANHHARPSPTPRDTSDPFSATEPYKPTGVDTMVEEGRSQVERSQMAPDDAVMMEETSSSQVGQCVNLLFAFDRFVGYKSLIFIYLILFYFIFHQIYVVVNFTLCADPFYIDCCLFVLFLGTHTHTYVVGVVPPGDALASHRGLGWEAQHPFPLKRRAVRLPPHNERLSLYIHPPLPSPLLPLYPQGGTNMERAVVVHFSRVKMKKRNSFEHEKTKDEGEKVRVNRSLGLLPIVVCHFFFFGFLFYENMHACSSFSHLLYIALMGFFYFDSFPPTPF
eukprot:gene10937-7592_t